MKSYSMTTEVLTEHIDTLGHVNNVQYLYWVQDAAHKHWEALIQNIDKPLGVWVVRSHSITYKQAALEGDKLTLKTYVKQSRGVLSERIVEIFNAEQKLLAVCSTQWCYINPINQKPEMIPNTVLELFQ
ncbi:MAG: acyl-CoA thioesterase [Flavobacteriaceae bacterium]|nr:acyl-CoA thioesterase [Flavobacteriaceae bacterium]